MSFLYPRTMAVQRAAQQAAGQPLGARPYGGQSKDTMADVIEDVRCNVQARGQNRANPTALPADTQTAQWSINIPLGAVPVETTIQDRDLITDDLGRRFRVTHAYPHSLGWRLTCERLSA